MAKVIIAIHGLRNKPSKEILEKWGILSIKEGLQRLNIDIDLPKFEVAYWADILYDKPLSPTEKNKKSPYYLREDYTPAGNIKPFDGHPYQRKIFLGLKKIIYAIFLSRNYKLRFSSVSKKFIHNNFKDLEVYFTDGCDDEYTDDCKKRDQINERLIKALKKHKNDDIFLVAHSMGSIIAFDVLSFIISHNITVNTFATIGSPLGAPFVISRIARLYKSKNQGHIKLQTPESVTKRWYNFSDINDPIALDFKLSDDFSANSKGVKVKDFIVENTYKKNGWANHHKSMGYLRTPEFVNALVEFINEK